METTKYEITYIIRPDLDDAAKTALVERFDKLLTDNGAELINSKDWSKRRFAYEIGGFNEGIYHVITLNATNDEALNEFDRLSKINDSILRHMIVKRED
ncbi:MULTISPECIES: 30S ribosomal protein S6 [Levilactobacillus]|jgi:small subunit ribosomal protein S6|uniref:Small ribosomal subunit protein bS6 n=2 Tax=Levilactobacillus TaxID=2767886 RepID=A0A4Z0J8V0_9LACO|nr:MULTISPECIES: 30S ribosomal protein S6 [Levilactobacillus]MCI1554392.1 30S ribosomal protein S6 [Levilactobacillus sp.]MCI1598277.1 30S ribosomal protein S6 [Levilactobacillus sp.]MCI1605324.1 30S ribosomal protein S6 [Levilactobacillus sp.]TGD19136.1 30S ribosomal protein S6 [Levilactobacillus suantsaiihabitans]